jgi:hypothetical protein
MNARASASADLIRLTYEGVQCKDAWSEMLALTDSRNFDFRRQWG